MKDEEPPVQNLRKVERSFVAMTYANLGLSRRMEKLKESLGEVREFLLDVLPEERDSGGGDGGN